MATSTRPHAEWTLADLHRRFGPMPAHRVRMRPAPGTATVEDVERINLHEDRLCELVDGILVEKTVGFVESFLALTIGGLLRAFASGRKLGIVAGADGTLEILPDIVRIPDVSYLSFERLAQIPVPGRSAPQIAPDLAVEVLSPGNTRKEMDEKLDDYFAAGVRLVWYVDPRKHTVRVYTARNESRLLKLPQTLEGGDVLPGFALPLADLFDIPPELEALARQTNPKPAR